MRAAASLLCLASAMSALTVSAQVTDDSTTAPPAVAAQGNASSVYQSLVKRGLEWLEFDSLEAAEACFRQAMAAEPAQKGNALLWRHIGQIQARGGLLDEALESYSLGLNLSPHTMGLLLDRASVYMRQERLDRALTDYNNVLDLNSDHSEALLMRAYIFMRQRLYKDARRDYNHLLRVNPVGAAANSDDGATDYGCKALLGLAILNDKDRRPQEAMENINRYITLYPASTDGYLVRAGFEMDRRQDEAALYDFTRAVELSPDDPEVFLARARFYSSRKNKREARRDLKTALSLGANPQEVAAEMQTR